MEVATLNDTAKDNIFRSFEDILEAIKHEENRDSEDDDEFLVTSDEEAEDESFGLNSERIIETCKEENITLRCEDDVDIEFNADDSLEQETKSTGDVDVNEIHKSKYSADFEQTLDSSILETHENKSFDYLKTYKNEHMLNSHLKCDSNDCKEKCKHKANKCGICHKLFRDKSRLVDHMFIHTGECPYECEICEKRFHQKASLKEHIISRHTTGDKRFKCTVCEKSFHKLSIFSKHMSVHDMNRFQCTLCEMTFRTSTSLRFHMKTLHETESNYICKKPFMNSETLKLHMEVHNGTEKPACNISDARFSGKADPQRHMYIHTGEKPYKHEMELNAVTPSPNKLQCTICKKFLSDEFKFEQHSEKHKSEARKAKTYTCEICGVILSNSASYRRHMKEIHKWKFNLDIKRYEGKRLENDTKGPFECDICLKMLKSKRTLKEHMNCVHLKKHNHVCNICNQTFFKSRDLRKHKDRRHAQIR